MGLVPLSLSLSFLSFPFDIQISLFSNGALFCTICRSFLSVSLSQQLFCREARSQCPRLFTLKTDYYRFCSSHALFILSTAKERHYRRRKKKVFWWRCRELSSWTCSGPQTALALCGTLPEVRLLSSMVVWKISPTGVFVCMDVVWNLCLCNYGSLSSLVGVDIMVEVRINTDQLHGKKNMFISLQVCHWTFLFLGRITVHSRWDPAR